MTASDSRGLRKLAGAASEGFAGGVVLYDGETGASFGDRPYAVPLSRLWGEPPREDVLGHLAELPPIELDPRPRRCCVTSGGTADTHAVFLYNPVLGGHPLAGAGCAAPTGVTGSRRERGRTGRFG